MWMIFKESYDASNIFHGTFSENYTNNSTYSINKQNFHLFIHKDKKLHYTD